ncbi:hypothetical protein ACFQ07_27710 [Actinomadura adrarensis]|uniref:Uncharacterized protein n=1 Tax=Actinomadura adrarensis TaxID=1819600 RepID=A0ABW3CNU7_9ACTN
MKTLSRILTSLALAATVTVTAVPGTAQAAPDFTQVAGTSCPLPWLETGYGNLSHCTQLSAAGADARAGFGSLETSRFSPTTGWLDVKDTTFRRFQVTGSDGVVGTFKGRGRLNAGGFGDVAYGIQYAYYGFQPIGRWGNYSFASGRFHPSGEWVNASGDI